MKFLILASFIVAATLAFPELELLNSEWITFKVKHGKRYGSIEEELEKLATFKNNLKTIEEHNKLFEAGESTFKMGVTRFADMTNEEFKAHLAKFKPQKPKSNLQFHAREGVAVPDTVDWRDSGIITKVKDQGECGACWAFSATGSLEAAYATATGNLVSLSEQQLVDCADGRWGNLGCGGGYMDSAFDYIKTHGIESEADYEYTELDGKCRFDRYDNASQVVTKISDYVDVARGEDNLLAAVAERPVSVAMDAALGFQLYDTGILDDIFCSNGDDDLNHGVLVIGYGSANDTDYWLIKNSWGPYWGEDGYVRLLRNADNACGISNIASYPLI